MYITDLIFRRGYYRRCRHRGHWVHLRTCMRGVTYDGYCAHHNHTCWAYCDRDAP
jgi:hypothetical protein